MKINKLHHVDPYWKKAALLITSCMSSMKEKWLVHIWYT